MRNILNMVIDDAAHGDYFALYGILDYLMNDCGLTVERIIEFADHTLHIPANVTMTTLEQLSVVHYH